jgi:Putative prokaryotic signal transducing protein
LAAEEPEVATAGDRSHQKLVPVYSTTNEMEARMVQEVLANAGIESMINSEVPSSLFPMNMGNMARQDILVLESAAAEANRILSELPPPSQTSDEAEE